MKHLYRMLRVVFIPDIEPLVQNKECLEAIQKTLKKGSPFVFSSQAGTFTEKFKNFIKQNLLVKSSKPPIIPLSLCGLKRESNNPVSAFFSAF